MSQPLLPGSPAHLAPNARLDGRSPADQLDSNMEAVVPAAQSMESVDEFSPALARQAREVAVHV